MYHKKKKKKNKEINFQAAWYNNLCTVALIQPNMITVGSIVF